MGRALKRGQTASLRDKTASGCSDVASCSFVTLMASVPHSKPSAPSFSLHVNLLSFYLSISLLSHLHPRINQSLFLYLSPLYTSHCIVYSHLYLVFSSSHLTVWAEHANSTHFHPQYDSLPGGLCSTNVNWVLVRTN